MVEPPRVRPAGSLGLLIEDLEALRQFRCFSPPGVWYEREAAKVLRRALRARAAEDLGERDRILLFERDGELMGVSVFSAESESTAHLGFVGIARELHGARIDSDAGDRLSDACVEATLDAAEALGYTRVTAQVARDHSRSGRLMSRAGFARLSRFDRDYDILAISL